VPPKLIQLKNPEYEDESESKRITDTIKFMTNSFNLPDTFGHFFSDFIVFTELLLYVIGKSIIATNLIIFDGDSISNKNKLTLWKYVQAKGVKNIKLNKVSLADLSDFDVDYVVNNDEIDTNVEYIRVSTLVENYEVDVTDKYINFFISLYNLDKILLTDTKLDAEALWKICPHKYCVMTLDGFKKNFKGIIKFGKAFAPPH
jgi:hypothetical protein